jgi:Peptidase family M48
MFAQTGIATLVAPALLIGNLAAAGGPDPALNPVVRALRFFEERAENQPVDMLKTLRPAPLPLAAREVVLANLPLEGEMQPDKNGRAKLAVVRGVLDLHERNRVFEIKVIDVAQAFVGLHARTAILISDRALRLLTSLELQAVVGHEMGHEYFWADYDRAVASGDSGRRREIELRCDGIAVLTALELNQDRHHLSSALRKLERFNDALGVLDVTNYPSVEDRERFIEALVGSLDERAARRSGGRSRIAPTANGG